MSAVTPKAQNHAVLAPLASRFVEVAKLPWEPTRFAGIETRDGVMLAMFQAPNRFYEADGRELDALGQDWQRNQPSG